jgi:alanyl-tRNA synthetase
MGEAYPELVKARSVVEQVLHREEERFAETLEQGMRILESCLATVQGKELPGETAFQLYDTYGFPIDLTADVVREHGLTVDMAGFERAMSQQRERARAASHFKAEYAPVLDLAGPCEFRGYSELSTTSRAIGLLREGAPVAELSAGDRGAVVLDRTPFYAESGGQKGDRGFIEWPGGRFEVTDTQKSGPDVIVHEGCMLEGRLSEGSDCRAVVNEELRRATALNHTATHLLHAALRRVLGEHVAQKGSLVEPERLRFDFAHFEPVSAEQLAEVERLVNEHIRRNAEVTASVMPKDQALAAGAMALFGEKYGDAVRVLRIGDFSTELCGGTHVQRAGDIGLFKIVSESGVAAGVRRIEGLTGAAALQWVMANERLLSSLAERAKTSREHLDERLQQIIDRIRSLEKELDRVNAKFASTAGDDLAARAVDVSGVKVLAESAGDADAKALRDLCDQLKQKLGSAVVVLGAVRDGKVNLVAGVTNDQTKRVQAGVLISYVAQQVGGKGGGRPDMAQAGGSDPASLPAALASVPEWVRQTLV